jgi:hypothetical protein
MQTLIKLREFLIGKANAALWLLRAVRLRDAPWLLFGFVVMLLIPPERDVPQSPQSEEYVRRDNASQ